MTNKIVLRTIEEFLTGYKPNYNPIMPLFLGKSKQYATEVGKVNFTQVDAVGDLRGRVISPKDTEMHQVGSKESKKSFVKYFLGAKYKQSTLQDRQGVEDVQAQVLDEHNKQSDELALGTSLNSGIYTSTDPNYVLSPAYEVQKETDGTHLNDLYAKMIADIELAQQIDGQLLVLTYGALFTPKYNSLFAATSKPFSEVIGGAAPGVSFAKMPVAITPANANGYIIINLDQILLHYTLLPTIKAQGINEEEMYAWTNFLMGSCMVEVKALGGITRQPITFEA